MKPFFVAAALAAAVMSLSAAHAVTPIHAYEFDVDASDSVGSADGTLLNGASVSGGNLLLDGNNDYVAFASHLVPTSGAYSVFIRVNGTPYLGSYTEIISQGASGGPGFYLGTAPGGGIRLTDNFTSPGVAFPTGVAELLLTSGGAGTSFYINGTLQFSSGSSAANGAGGSPTYFGRQFEPYGEYFAGSIDAIRIYDSVILPSGVIEPTTGVPEPSSWAMLLFGFGLTGAMARRGRTRVSA
jgi:hypothetical protein